MGQPTAPPRPWRQRLVSLSPRAGGSGAPSIAEPYPAHAPDEARGAPCVARPRTAWATSRPPSMSPRARSSPRRQGLTGPRSSWSASTDRPKGSSTTTQAHQTDSARTWLLVHPRCTFWLTPTCSSWTHQVERWFSSSDHQLPTAQRRRAYSWHQGVGRSPD